MKFLPAAAHLPRCGAYEEKELSELLFLTSVLIHGQFYSGRQNIRVSVRYCTFHIKRIRDAHRENIIKRIFNDALFGDDALSPLIGADNHSAADVLLYLTANRLNQIVFLQDNTHLLV